MSERRDHTLELAPLALFAVDHQERFVSVDGRDAAALLGADPARLVDQPIALAAARLPWLVGDVRRALRGEALAERRPADGRWFELRAGVERDGDGRVTLACFAALDVTERAEADRAEIERATSLLTATLNATDDGIFTVDAAGNVGFVNRRFLSMWHMSEAMMRLPDFRQRMAFILDQLEDPDDYLARAHGFYEHPERETYHELRFKDGRVFERYSHPQWVQGRCVGRVLSFRDVTAQRRAERERDRLLVQEQAARAAAEASERRAAFLAESTTLFAASLDYEGTLAAASRRAVPELADGCLAFAFDDAALRCLDAVHPDAERRAAAQALGAFYAGRTREALPGELGRALAGGEPLLMVEPSDAWLERQAAGAEHLARLRALGMRSLMTVPLSARGFARGALLLFASDPARRFGPSDLTFALDFARRVALAVDNARLYGEAERAVRMRDEFLSVASHELRTPLTSLRLTTQALLYLEGSYAGAPVAPAITQKLQSIDRQSRRLGGLIDMLLDVSRTESGTFTLNRADGVDLAQLAGEVVASMSERIERSNHAVEVVAPEPVIGCWDRFRLEQVLNNLIANALRHGNGKPITVAVAAGEAVATLSVRDQGEGIAPDLQPKIFEKFERGTLSRSHGGMGLGLYITRRIVEGHGGTIEVKSAPGAGATFTVKLPRRP